MARRYRRHVTSFKPSLYITQTAAKSSANCSKRLGQATCAHWMSEAGVRKPDKSRRPAEAGLQREKVPRPCAVGQEPFPRTQSIEEDELKSSANAKMCRACKALVISEIDARP